MWHIWKNTFQFLCSELIFKLILLKTMDEYHSSIFTYQRGQKFSQLTQCLNSELIHKETFNLSKGSSEMEKME